MNVRVLALSMLALLPLQSFAGEEDLREISVYETMAGVSIGRVFLSPAERKILDVKRANPPRAAVTTGQNASDTGESSTAAPAAGYIINSSGRARFWMNGGFVESGESSPAALKFPGDVKIVRHHVPQSRSDATPDMQPDGAGNSGTGAVRTAGQADNSPGTTDEQ